MFMVATTDKIAARAAKSRFIYETCAHDLLAFCATFGTRIDKRSGRVLPLDFDERPYQREFLKEYSTHDRIVLLKARQIGFSTIMAWTMLWEVLFTDNTPVVFTSYVLEDGKKLMNHIRRTYHPSLPEWMAKKLPAITNEAVTEIEFENGSNITLRASGKGDPGRGTAAKLAFCDEFASMQKQQAALASLVPAVEDGGKLIVGGTMKLPDGVDFKDLWIEADKGLNEWRNLFYGWDVVLTRDQDWFERVKRTITDRHKRAMEHPETPDDAFTHSGRLVFDVDLLNAQLPYCTDGDVGYLRDGGAYPEFVFNELGDLRVWLTPTDVTADGLRVVIGADACQGIQGGDYASIVVLCKDGRIAAEWHKRCDAHVMGDALDLIGRWYHNALIGVERNGSGEAVLSKLILGGYPAIFRDTKRVVVGESVLAALGWTTTVQSKHALKDELVEAVSSGWLNIPSTQIIEELKGYVINEDNNKLEGSPFDDRVIACALAVMMCKFDGDPAATAAPELEPEEWSLEWWELNDQRRREAEKRQEQYARNAKRMRTRPRSRRRRLNSQ